METWTHYMAIINKGLSKFGKNLHWLWTHYQAVKIRDFLTNALHTAKTGGKDLSSDLKIIFHHTTAPAPEAKTATNELLAHIQKPLRFVFGVLAVTIGIFVVWGGLAPLDSAAVAQGYVALSGNRKTIQHQEGGTIEKIFVSEGDTVTSGQVLLKLNDTAAQARAHIALSQLRIEKAVLKRLLAERDNLEAPDFRDSDLELDLPEVHELIKTQTDLFINRRKALNGQLEVLQQRILQQEEAMKGMESQDKSMQAQVKLIREELKNLQVLYERGLALQSRLLEMRRAEEEIEGRLGELRANMARSREIIAETKLQLLNVENDVMGEINDALKETQSRVLDLQEQYRTAVDILERTSIKAQDAGIITGLEYHTVGGVITPGGRIMDIIPQDDKLIIEAKVSPRDIESIQVGLVTRVQLGAYKTRLVPRVEGKVIYISADRFSEPHNPAMPYYYLAKIEISEKEIARINYEVRLYPGMPADVFIVKGERTFLQYLLSPLFESFHKAFKEA